ncbi:MAG: extracellular solute-binding protein [Clostridia bacterium]|nr:extracellular solute-binding protein [Clostridia bacterium]
MKFKRLSAIIAAVCLIGASATAFVGCAEAEQTVTLRVCSWEEYIDLGGWEEDERLDIENPFTNEDSVFGKNSVVDDFTEWFYDEYGYKVKVEYSTFGTNEDLYNRLSLGDVYDLVCPSDYMMMKLLAEDAVEKYSESFFKGENNYYAQYVSPYIDDVFAQYGWTDYAACYMWGTTGLVYNPEMLKAVEDVATVNILLNEDYKRRITAKDNVRDSYFAALGIVNEEQLTDTAISAQTRSSLLNDTESGTIAKAEDVLKRIKENVYSFETDSGKADMVTGKVVANYQWSGDAVHIMDEADGDDTELWYSVPAECSNLWFDGWIMLKNGIDGNDQKREAAEAFVNFLSRPDNAVRNMYYIGYTSAIAGDTVYDYMEYNYAAEDDADETFEYDVSYFFGENSVITADAACFDIEENGEINRGRQLFAQYPPANVTSRSVVMLDFGDKLGEINQMWINVRCLDLLDISPVTAGVVIAIICAVAAAITLYVFRYKLFIKNKPRKGYTKIEN